MQSYRGNVVGQAKWGGECNFCYKSIVWRENYYICGTKIWNMNIRPNIKYNKILQAAAEVLILPAFFVLFVLLYDPFHILEYYSFGAFSFGFHITMLACIMLVLMIPMHIIWYLMNEKNGYGTLRQILFYIAEVFVVACFMALYTQLFRKNEGGWFQSLSHCLKYSYLTLCYPIAITIMLKAIFGYRKKIAMGGESNMESMVKLYDEHKRLKLTIAPINILYVRAESNYVSINYIESNKVKEYLLRSSMKSIEETLSGYGMTRCHRSYLVNPKHVSILGKDTDGFTYATLDTVGIPKVPVSKQYCDSLAALL